MFMLLGTLAFLLEIAAWIALGRWGWQTGHAPATRWLLALTAPLAFMVLWGIYLSPKAKVNLPSSAKSTLQVVVFTLAALAAMQVWDKHIAATFLLLAAGTFILARFTGDLT